MLARTRSMAFARGSSRAWTSSGGIHPRSFNKAAFSASSRKRTSVIALKRSPVPRKWPGIMGNSTRNGLALLELSIVLPAQYMVLVLLSSNTTLVTTMFGTPKRSCKRWSALWRDGKSTTGVSQSHLGVSAAPGEGQHMPTHSASN